jgi:hypothetical protein
MTLECCQFLDSFKLMPRVSSDNNLTCLTFYMLNIYKV